MRLCDLAIERQDLWIQCVLCTHFTRWLIVDLQSKCGSRAELSKIVGRFKCNHCGTNSAAFRYRQPMCDLRLLERYRKG